MAKWYCAVAGSSANGMCAPSAYGTVVGPDKTLEEAKKNNPGRFDAYGEEVVTYFRGEVEEIV